MSTPAGGMLVAVARKDEKMGRRPGRKTEKF